jgi:protein involved in polysaccharide export with SLBB domain
MRLLQLRFQPFFGIASLAAAALILTGCVSPHPQPQPKPPTPTEPLKADNIPLQIGDTVTVDLTGTPGPTIPQSIFVLSGAGTISLPILETNIPAIGKTPHELEQIIHDLYVPGQFTHINVVVTPGVRYFVVSGAINNTGIGKQPYTGKMTVLRAIGAAGGFNPFAARKRVQLTRQDGTILIENCTKALKNPTLDLEVLPGDKIFVDQENFWEALSHLFGK